MTTPCRDMTLTECPCIMEAGHQEPHRCCHGVRWVDIDQVKIGERRRIPALIFGNFRKEYR